MTRWSIVSRKLNAPLRCLGVGTITSPSVGNVDYLRLSSQRVGGTASHDEEDQSTPSSQYMGGTASHVEAYHLTLSSQCVQAIARQVTKRNESMLFLGKILLKLGLYYDVIYEQAKAMSLADKLDLAVEDLRNLREGSLFWPASKKDVLEDEATLWGRLQSVIQRQDGNSNDMILARYLLSRLPMPSMSEDHGLEDLGIMYDASILQVSDTVLKATWGVSNKSLGSGSGALCVFRTKWQGIDCAKTVVYQAGIDMESVFRKEAAVMARINHPNIVKFFCCGISTENDQCFIGTELMERSLSNLIEERRCAGGCFPMPVALDIILQIARGMLCLHELGIAHHNFKPHKVGVLEALNDFFLIKLQGFGMANTEVEALKSHTPTYLNPSRLIYRAPETWNFSEHVNWFKADVLASQLRATKS